MLETNHCQPPDLRSLETQNHSCAIYESLEQMKRQFVPFLQAGLSLGERCVYLVHETKPELVYEAMQENGFDIKPYVERDAFQVIDGIDVYLKDGYFKESRMLSYWTDALARAYCDGFAGLRAAAEMTWALSESPGCERLAPYESRLNCFTDMEHVSVLCQYSRAKFPAETLKAVIHAHPVVIANDEAYFNSLYVRPEDFTESSADLDLQLTLDNLALINNLQKVNDALEDQRKASQALCEELQNLARVVSHEMQAPLGLITSYLRLLAVRYAGQLGPDADEFISTSVKSARVLSRMIEDLWTYARVDTVEGTVEDVPALAVLGEALEELRFEDLRAQITYEQLPSVRAVKRNLTYVLKALIDNACKHRHPERPPSVHVSCSDEGVFWRFKVADNGLGIDPVYSTEVFRMFHRLNGRPDEEGTGMGLSIVKRIVEKHGGNIWFSSAPGEGSTFYFTIPNDTSNVRDIKSVSHQARDAGAAAFS
jgi:signal transduction histidine kinase